MTEKNMADDDDEMHTVHTGAFSSNEASPRAAKDAKTDLKAIMEAEDEL
jgi:hypothetical protein